ncbi:hypothetical protein EJ104_05010, partial [Deinococcus radiophilus]
HGDAKVSSDFAVCVAALLQPLGSSQAPLLKLGTRILVRLPFHGPWSLAAHTCAAINSRKLH